MGMYTELHFNVELKAGTPQTVIDTLAAMVAGEETTPLDDHALFRTARWGFMLRCDSYYFDADTISTFRYDDIASRWYLCVRCNLKNYDDEIAKFIDWIMPWVETQGFLGFWRYEEDGDPTLIYNTAAAA